MADGRLFLRCKHCGDQEYLFKWYWPSSGELKGPSDVVETFMMGHINGFECRDVGRQQGGFDDDALELVPEGRGVI